MIRLFVLFCFLLCISCDRQYDGETRLVVQGQIVNSQGAELPGCDVKVFVGDFSSAGFLGNSPDLIAIGQSNQSGNFKFLFPAPKFNQTLEVSIENTNSDLYQSKSFFIDSKSHDGYRFDFKKIVLYKRSEIVPFKIIINRINANVFLSKLSITAIQPNEFVDLRANAIVENNADILLDYQVIINQSFAINYTIQQNGLVSNLSTVVAVGIDASQFTINL